MHSPRATVDGNDDRAMQPPIGLRVRRGGVTSGWVIALGTILLTALGLAIGISAIGDPRTADRDTASGWGRGPLGGWHPSDRLLSRGLAQPA